MIMKNNELNNFITDEQLTEFFDAKEAGKTYAEALDALHLKALSQSEESEMKAFWDMHDRVSGLAAEVHAPESLVKRIIGETSERISNFAVSFPEQKQQKVIASPYVRTVDYLKRPIRSSWKIITPITVIFFALVGMLGTEDTLRAPPSPAFTANDRGAARLAVVTERIDSVDEILSTLSSETDMEASLFADVNNDIALIEGDASTAGELSNAYDETTF
jgi:hypothetical protein